jgi:hypothetical protein
LSPSLEKLNKLDPTFEALRLNHCDWLDRLLRTRKPHCPHLQTKLNISPTNDHTGGQGREFNEREVESNQSSCFGFIDYPFARDGNHDGAGPGRREYHGTRCKSESYSKPEEASEGITQPKRNRIADGVTFAG